MAALGPAILVHLELAVQSAKGATRAHPEKWKMKAKNFFRASRGLIVATAAPLDCLRQRFIYGPPPFHKSCIYISVLRFSGFYGAVAHVQAVDTRPLPLIFHGLANEVPTHKHQSWTGEASQTYTPLFNNIMSRHTNYSTPWINLCKIIM